MRCLQCYWRKTRSEADQEEVRAYIRTYLVIIRWVKHNYIFALVASVDSQLGFFLKCGPCTFHCEKCSWYLSDKVSPLCSELDSGWTNNLKMTETCLSLVIREEFESVSLEEVDRVLGTVSVATYAPPGWLRFRGGGRWLGTSGD